MILESCPFCGSAGKATKDEAGDWMAFCSSNACEASPMIVHKATEKEAAEAWNARVSQAEALALLRELNDALVIPGWLQPRVDTVLDRAEGEPTESAIRPTEEAARAFWRYWERNGITHVHGYYESTWGAINAALRTSGIVQHRYGSTLKEMLDSGHPPQEGKP